MPHTPLPYTTLFRSFPLAPSQVGPPALADAEHLGGRHLGHPACLDLLCQQRHEIGAQRQDLCFGVIESQVGEHVAGGFGDPVFITGIDGHGAPLFLHYGTSLYRALPFSMRSEEHTSELQSLMRISYAVFCLKKKNK